MPRLRLVLKRMGSRGGKMILRCLLYVYELIEELCHLDLLRLYTRLFLNSRLHVHVARFLESILWVHGLVLVF
jgi:hypothetical protein